MAGRNPETLSRKALINTIILGIVIVVAIVMFVMYANQVDRLL